MNKKMTVLASFVAMLALVFVCANTAVASDYETEFTSPFTSDVPTLDGNFTTDDEWADAFVTFWWFEPESLHPDGYIYLYMKNTNDTLYVCLDLTPDDTAESDDFVFVGVDENNDGEYDFAFYPRDDAEYYAYMERGGELHLASVEDRVNVAFGFAESPNEDSYDHTIIEMAIPLASLDFEDGSIGTTDTIGFHVEGYGTMSPWVYPRDSTPIFMMTPEDAEDWAQITLGHYTAPPTPEPEPEPTVVDHSQNIGLLVGIIGGIIILASVIFREELDNKYAWLIMLGLILVVLGFLNYEFGYVKTIPYIYE